MRAAARSSRGVFEEEAERAIDALLAGPLPEAVGRSLVEHQVLERVAAGMVQADARDGAAAGPAAEKLVANVEASSGIEQDRGELDTHTVIARDGLMEHGLAVVGGAVMRPAAGQDQLEALATLNLLLRVVVFMAGQGTPEHPEPARVIARPIDVLQRHADDLRGECAGATP